MNIGNITSNNSNLDYNGKVMQIEFYEQLIEQLQQENNRQQNNWNELKECIRQWIVYHSVCDKDYKELNVLEDVKSKMQELEQGSD